MIRHHRIQAGDALDRGVLEELFNQGLSRLNEISSRSIGNGIFDRSDFAPHAFMEMWYVKESSLQYALPGNPPLASGTIVAIRTDDTFVDGILTYSLELEAAGTNAIMCAAWPVFGGQILVNGESYRSPGDEKGYPGGAPTDPVADLADDDNFTIGDKVTLSGSAAFGCGNARHSTGVMLFVLGNWELQSSQLFVRTRV